MHDADTNGSIDGQDNGNPQSRWTYFMGTFRYDLADWLYLAARYSAAMPLELIDLSADGV